MKSVSFAVVVGAAVATACGGGSGGGGAATEGAAVTSRGALAKHAETPHDAGRHESECRQDDADGCLDLFDRVRGDPSRVTWAIKRDGRTETIDASSFCSTARDCFVGGSAMLNGSGGIAPRPGIGVFLLAWGCDQGEADACITLGAMHMNGKRLARDPRRGTAEYRRACKLAPRGSACTSYGMALLQTAENQKAAKAGLGWLAKGCEQRDHEACFAAGLAYQQGIGVDRSAEMAAAWFGRACDLGNDDGCVQRGRD